MRIISESQCRRLLSPFEPVFVASIVDAYATWTAKTAPTITDPTKRSRATVLHDLIMANVARALDTVPGVSVLRGRRVLLRVCLAGHPAVIVQFKKLNGERRPRNYPTRTALLFDRQEPLAEIPPDTRLTVGYRLNKHGTAILDIHTVCMSGRGIAWLYEIMPAAPATLTLPIARPATPARRVRPTAAAASKRGKIRRRPGSGSQT